MTFSFIVSFIRISFVVAQWKHFCVPLVLLHTNWWTFFTNKSMLVPRKVCEVYLANSLSSTHFWRYEIFANLMLMICLILSACKLLRRALLQHLNVKIKFELEVKPPFKGRWYRKNMLAGPNSSLCSTSCILSELLHMSSGRSFVFRTFTSHDRVALATVWIWQGKGLCNGCWIAVASERSF